MLVVGVVIASVVLAYVLVRHGAAAAMALVFLPAIVWLLSRFNGGLVIGVALLLVVPYWYTLGSAQADVLRVASFVAATTLLFARGMRPSPIDWVVGIFAAVLILGWILQYDHPHAGRVLSQELTPVGFYIGARAIQPARVRSVFIAILIAGTVGALTVLYEFAVHHLVFPQPQTTYLWQATSSAIFRPAGIFGSPPAASTAMAFVIMFGLACRSFLRGRRRLGATICVAICALALVLTFTRAAIIGAAFAAILYLWLIRSPILRPLRVAWFAGVVTIVVILVLPSLQTSTSFQKEFVRADNVTVRESYWSAALPVVTANTHNLIFGIGTASLETPFISSNAPVSAQVAAVPTMFTNSLHNQYVTSLVEGGLSGLAAVVLLLVAPFIASLRRARARQDPLAASLAGGLLAMGVVMTADTAFLIGTSFAMLMLTIGLAATITSARETGDGHDRKAVLADGTRP
jgi:O-antigen ligase